MNHFRGGVSGGATGCGHAWTFFGECATETEVYESDIAVTVEKNVLGFDVAMCNVELVVEVVEGTDELDEVFFGFIFAESASAIDVVQEGSSIEQLENKKGSFGRVDDVIELCDKGMMHLFEKSHFAVETRQGSG